MEKSLEHTLQRWILIGPLLLLISFLAVFYRFAIPIWMPLEACVGVLLSWKWSLRGLGIALVMLGMSLLLRITLHSSPEIGWELGLSVALGLGLGITTLSFQETSQEVKQQIDQAHSSLSKQCEDLKISRDELEKEVSLHTEQLTSCEQMLTATRKALNEAREEKERIQQLFAEQRENEPLKIQAIQLQLQQSQTELRACEIHYQNMWQTNKEMEELLNWKETAFKEQETSLKSIAGDLAQCNREKQELVEKFEHAHEAKMHLESRLKQCEADLSAQAVYKQKIEEELQELRGQIGEDDESKRELQADHAKILEEKEKLESSLAKYEADLSAQAVYKQKIEEELQELRGQIGVDDESKRELQADHAKILEEKEKLKSSLVKCEADLSAQTSHMQIINHQFEAVLTEKHSESQLFRQKQGLFKQLREQFQEKSQILDQQRREQFSISEKLEALNREIIEQRFYERDKEMHQFEKYVLLVEKEFQSEKEVLEKERDHLEVLISHLINS